MVNSFTKNSGNPKTARYLNMDRRNTIRSTLETAKEISSLHTGITCFFNFLTYHFVRNSSSSFSSFNNFSPTIYISVDTRILLHVFPYLSDSNFNDIYSSFSDPWREMLLGERRNRRTPLRGRRFAGRWHCGRARGVGRPRAPRRYRAQAPGTRQPRHFLRLLEEFNPYQTPGQGGRGRTRERLRERDLREEAHFRPCTCSFYACYYECRETETSFISICFRASWYRSTFAWLTPMITRLNLWMRLTS